MTNVKLLTIAIVFSAGLVVGCGSNNADTKDRDFHTSGSREADQRAEQRIAKDEQLRGGKEGAGGAGGTANAKKTLYDRLGGEQGTNQIVDDFVNRVLADPRVNWERKGLKTGGVMGIGASSGEWNANAENVAKLKKHLVQFLALATGGPAKYEGKEMVASHRNLRITNAEFDASIGDMKASLDNLAVPVDEQKELLAIVESTRPQVVTER